MRIEIELVDAVGQVERLVLDRVEDLFLRNMFVTLNLCIKEQRAALADGSPVRCGSLSYYEEGCRSAG